MCVWFNNTYYLRGNSAESDYFSCMLHNVIYQSVTEQPHRNLLRWVIYQFVGRNSLCFSLRFTSPLPQADITSTWSHVEKVWIWDFEDVHVAHFTFACFFANSSLNMWKYSPAKLVAVLPFPWQPQMGKTPPPLLIPPIDGPRPVLQRPGSPSPPTDSRRSLHQRPDRTSEEEAGRVKSADVAPVATRY